MTKRLSPEEKRYSMLMNHIKGNITRRLKKPMPLGTQYVSDRDFNLFFGRENKFDIIAEINKDMNKGKKE